MTAYTKEKLKNAFIIITLLLCLGCNIFLVVSTIDTSYNVANAYERVGLQFNQLFTLPDTYENKSGLTTKLISNFTYHTYGVYDGSSNSNLLKYESLPSSFIINHKYYFNLNTSSDLLIGIRNSSTGKYSNFDKVCIYDSIFNSNRMYIWLKSPIIGTSYDIRFSPIIVDLTVMFGEGKEPKTIEEVQKYICSGTYYPYTPIVDIDKITEDARNEGFLNGKETATTILDVLSSTSVYDDLTASGQVPTGIKQEFDIIHDGSGTASMIPRVRQFNYKQHWIPYSDMKVCILTNGVKILIPRDLPFINTIEEYTLDFVLGTSLARTWSSQFDCLSYFRTHSTSTKMYCLDYDFVTDDPDNYVEIATFKNLTNSLAKEFCEANSGVFQNGFDDGYSSGKSEGTKIGYDEGYKAALNSKNSFTDLANAVVGMPVKFMEGIFNFNVLGYNMSNIMFSLLTLCMFLVILNLVLRGRG